MTAALVPSPAILSQQQDPVTCVSQSAWDKKEEKILVSHQSSVGLSCGYPSRTSHRSLLTVHRLLAEKTTKELEFFPGVKIIGTRCFFVIHMLSEHYSLQTMQCTKLQYLAYDEKSNFKNDNSNAIITGPTVSPNNWSAHCRGRVSPV